MHSVKRFLLAMLTRIAWHQADCEVLRIRRAHCAHLSAVMRSRKTS